VNDDRLTAFLSRAERFMDRVESALRLDIDQPDWDQAIAFRYRKRVSGQGYIVPVRQVGAMRLDDLREIDIQKEKIRRNTAQFVAGLTANNVLLTGARGTGKSSLVRACLNTYCNQGLRLIEVDKEHLVDLPDIVEIVATRPEKFLIFCDDLSFDQGEPGYKALKSVLDGSVSETSANVLIYATSNRRHLLPEYMAENMSYTHTDSGEVHPGEGVEEKISLSERFGLWVSFYPFTQDEYLHIAVQWLGALGVSPERVLQARPEALIWALERGSRTGRVAWQFAKDYAWRQPPVAGTGSASAGP
jgi:hypothetical protein